MCTAGPTRWPARGRRGRADLPGRPAAVRRLRRPRAGHLRRPVRRRGRPAQLRRAAHRASGSTRPGRCPRGCGPRLDGDPRRAHRRGRRPGQYAELFAAHARARLPDLRQRRHAPAVGRAPAARPSRAGRRAGRARRLDVRLRRRRAALGLPDAERARRRRVRGQGGRRRRRSTCCARTSRRPCPSCCSTPWPGGWSGAARRCSARSSETQPRYALFGHVHQPLARRVRIGRTECVNVGHFRATGMPVRCWSGSGIVAAAARPG